MNRQTLETPVLFIIFKREQEALETLKAIAKVRPKKLYIAADGPRTGVANEDHMVMATREAVLAAVDWECEVKTNFQVSNLGCGPGVLAAINWFFREEESGIILEDDCVALPSFFHFCETLLQRYANDDRVGLISGFNNIPYDMGPYSYCFSKYTVCWGWATWRRAWKHMDYEMGWLQDPWKENVLLNAGYNGKDRTYWERRVEAVHKNTVSAWDYQWCFTIAAQNQLGIFPAKNLISNIGIGEGATHTTKSPLVSYSAGEDLDFPLNHPKAMAPNMGFDKTFYKSRNNLVNTLAWFFPKPVKDFVKSAIAVVYNKQ